MIANKSFKLISNNVKGLQSTKKRLKLIESLNRSLLPSGILFLQETHSTATDEVEWKDDFKSQLYFSHGTSNSCGVLIGFIGMQNVVTNDTISDKNGSFLILNASLNDESFVLVNLYNPNTEAEQLKTMEELSVMLKTLSSIHSSKIILGGDFNFFFNLSLESCGGNPRIKNNSIAKFIEIKELFDLCDIWRVRNRTLKRYTFRQKHFSGFIQRRLDYIFISNSLQESVLKTEVLPSVLSDHSPVQISFGNSDCLPKGPGIWKMNNSLLGDADFVNELKQFIDNTTNTLKYLSDNQLKWELLKYEIRKFVIKFSKCKSKKIKKKRTKIENKLQLLEDNHSYIENRNAYDNSKDQLNEILENIAEGVRIRSRCQWYEEGEKSNKFFLNLEKKRAIEGQIRKVVANDREISDPKLIEYEIKSFYKTLFRNNITKSELDNNHFLEEVDLPVLSLDEKLLCEGELTEKELYNSMKSMSNNKSPGNDGLSKGFYEVFWENVKEFYISSIQSAKDKNEFSISQRQAIIKLIEKKDRDKRFIKNWRPISLLNVDYKIASKALAERLKKVLPTLISNEQTAYVKDRFIGETGRLLADIIEITDTLNIDGILVTMDIEKAFDSLNHSFIITVLKKYGFGDSFINWIKAITSKQESCVINAGKTTPFFRLERGARQGDPISAYIFILVIEVLFRLIKNNVNIEGLRIFDHCFLYSAYADDATFFLKNKQSVLEVIDVFKIFSTSGLKPNISKCEIAGIGVLKGVNLAVCGMKNIDLTVDAIKILGLYFSYNQIIQNDLNFCKTISKIQSVLKVWRMRNLTLEGKITIFKSLALSKIVYTALVIPVSLQIINEITRIQKTFIWNNSTPKIKNKTLRMDFSTGGLKNVDVFLKVISLRCSWVKRLFDNTHHEWKIMPLRYIEKTFGNNFRFHSNLDFDDNFIKIFPKFYQTILLDWKNYLSNSPTVISTMANQFLWFNRYIKINNMPVFFKIFSDKKINFVKQLFKDNGCLKEWNELKAEYELEQKFYFCWMQLINAIPKEWKKEINQANVNLDLNTIIEHHVIQKSRIVSLEKLNSREIYWHLIISLKTKPTSQVYFENIFGDLDWSKIYLIPRMVTVNTHLRCFQYKILNNILYLNKKLFLFGNAISSKCSFCNSYDETTIHLLSGCVKTQALWLDLKSFFRNDFNLPLLTPQTAIFGFDDIDEKIFEISNHLLLIYKFNIYKSREKNALSVKTLLKDILKVKKNEKCLANSHKKVAKYNKKWRLTHLKLPV